MQKHELGKSDLQITPIGIGAWAMGGGNWEFSWGPQQDSDSIAAIHAALDHGINWIDTAAVYGLGHSEEIVARALDQYKNGKNRPYVFTKCSLVWNQKREISHSLKAESIRRECEASLRRLKIDAIDLYQIHWPQPEEGIEEGWTEMARLKKEGKVRNIGVSNFNMEQMKRAQAIAPITSLQPPYSMLRRDVEGSILPFALKNSIGVIVYSPMFSGLLSGAMTRERVAALPPDDWRRRDSRIPGAAPFTKSRRGGAAQENREETWPHRRRSGDRLDVAQPRGDRSDCRRSHTRAGAGNYRRRRFPACLKKRLPRSRAPSKRKKPAPRISEAAKAAFQIFLREFQQGALGKDANHLPAILGRES